MAAGWHTALSNPRNYVDWLIGLKEKTPVDTAWYAPASGLPSNVHILCYSGFDLFDFRAVDLKTAQQQFCTPEGEFPADAIDNGICTCSGCQEKNLKLHNRQALLQEIALISPVHRSITVRAIWWSHAAPAECGTCSHHAPFRQPVPGSWNGVCLSQGVV